MKIHALAAVRVRAGTPVFVLFSPPASFRLPCGKNCADRANSEEAVMGYMSCRGPINDSTTDCDELENMKSLYRHKQSGDIFAIEIGEIFSI
jgi:hypothetical protein